MPRNSGSPVEKTNRLGKNISIELYMGDVNLSKYVDTVRILNDISAAWPQIFISLSIDSSIIIDNDIYGQKELTLHIYVSGEDSEILEKTIFDLLVLESNMNIIPKNQDTKNVDFQPTSILAVPLYAYNFMSTFINTVLEEGDTPKSPVDFFKSIVTEAGFTGFEIDRSGHNTQEIDQAIIPPMNMKQVLEYLNSYYRFYKGPFYYYADHHGKFHMWDIKERLCKDPVLQIFQLATGSGDPTKLDKIISESAYNPRIVYTRDIVESLYFGNAKVLLNGYNTVDVTHPSNDLYHNIVNNIEEVSTKEGILCDNSEIKLHPNLKTRKRYIHDHSGDQTEENFTSRISDMNRRFSGLRISLRRNVFFQNVVKLGEPVEFKPLHFDYQRYRGKYFLGISDLRYERSDNWECVCKLTIYRTAQSMYKTS